MRWDLLFFQQFLDSALHGKLHESQTLRAQVVSAVPLEPEVQELAQMISVLMGHDLPGFPYEIIVHAWHLGFGILQNAFLALQGFGTCQIQQCIAVVKQRSRGNDFVGVTVHEETEIPVMPVGIENDGVKNDHVIQCLDIFLAQGCVECPDGFHTAAADDSPYGYEGNIFAGEQLAGGAQGLLPAGNGIVDGIDF